jgi:beta-glucosidase
MKLRSRFRGAVVTLVGAVLLAGVPASADPQSYDHGHPRQPVIGQPDFDHGCAEIERKLPTLNDWPRVQSSVIQAPWDEWRIRQILAKMTLAEKVGQMTQPEIGQITPDEVKQYAIGSVLNGGGSWPGGNKHATPQDWLNLADAYWTASKTSRLGVPAIWGIDAVHGNNNVFGATTFPQNIALGAAHDPCLVRQIGAATATQVRATGQDWAFGPTVAVPQDDRWGQQLPPVTRRRRDRHREALHR